MIAPTLWDYLMRPDAPGLNTYAPEVQKAARDELRALLAVANAAHEADILHVHNAPAGSRPKTCGGCRLRLALARLDRVSSGTGQRKGGAGR